MPIEYFLIFLIVFVPVLCVGLFIVLPAIIECRKWTKLKLAYPLQNQAPDDNWRLSEIAWSRKEFAVVKTFGFMEAKPFSDNYASINYDRNGIYLRPHPSFGGSYQLQMAQLLMLPLYKKTTICIPWREVLEVKQESDVVSFVLRDGKELFSSNSKSAALENSLRFTELNL